VPGGRDQRGVKGTEWCLKSRTADVVRFFFDMQKHHYRYLFGPVHSRRLGLSLGVDLLDRRRCSFDCRFCEVGATDALTLERREYVPTAAVLAELREWLADGGIADVVTLAGSGEPTLHSGFGDVIDGVHAACDIPVALLTNSTMLWDADVREAAARADLVKVSLSAWDDASLLALNRPAAGVTFARLLDGLHAFRAVYPGRLWVETMLVRGINDKPEHVARIAALVGGLRPDKVQLNTVVRPPADSDSAAVEWAVLQDLATLFTPPAEVIAPHGDHAEGQRKHDAHIAELVQLKNRHRKP
jgi:wyosine [tRNA(Phe)-imidazoG37] synthetase (radical SAM superfamily)